MKNGRSGYFLKYTDPTKSEMTHKGTGKHDQKKKKSPETDPKETEIYKLPNKEFKINIMGASLVAQW